MDQFHERDVVRNVRRIADALGGADDDLGSGLPTPIERIADALERIADTQDRVAVALEGTSELYGLNDIGALLCVPLQQT